jgi:hypothetical protein
MMTKKFGMTKTDFDLVGGAVADLPIGHRLGVYRRLVRSLGDRYPQFDPSAFGESCNIPPLFRVSSNNNEEVSNASPQEH